MAVQLVQEERDSRGLSERRCKGTKTKQKQPYLVQEDVGRRGVSKALASVTACCPGLEEVVKKIVVSNVCVRERERG